MTPRRAAALRFGTSVGIAGGVTWFVLALLPDRLSVVTDIVGYPTHANFNYKEYFWRYYLGVLFAPALATLLYHLIGLRWPNSRWPDSKPAPAPEGVQTLAWKLVLSQALRALAVGATLGLGCTLLDQGGAHFWRDLLAVTLGYAAALFAIAAAATRRGTVERFAELTARCNALAIPFTVSSLYAASVATRVTVAADGSVHAYPWLPGWAAAVATAILLLATLIRCVCARDPTAVRRVELHALLFVVLPIGLYLYTAVLPPAFRGFATFHEGEFLAAARLFDEGAFPWRDSIYIHGLLQDVLIPLAGFKLFGDTAWGGLAGFTMLAGPVWWITLFLLLAYLFRGNVPLLVAAAAVPLLRTYDTLYWRFALFPPILLALAALLQRATWLRASLLAFALLVANVLVPELAYSVPACGVALLGFELTRYDRERPFSENLPRTIRAAVASFVVAALWAAYLFRHRAGAAFLHYYATFAPGHALTGAIPHSGGTDLFMFLSPLLVLLAFWYCVAAVRMRRELDVRDWVMVAGAIVTLLYYQKFLSRADYPHLVHALSPALPLFGYAIYKLLPLFGLGSKRALAASAGVLVAVAVWLAPDGPLTSLARVPSNFALVVPAQPVFDKLGWSEPTMATQAAGWQEVRQFLQATLDPGDSIFDFSNEPGLYHYLLGRKPATRYYHVSMAIRRGTQLDLIEELDRARPKLIAFDSDFGLPEWDGVPNAVRHYEISRYILHRYRPFARVRGRVFYVRNELTLNAEAAGRSIELLGAPSAYVPARACDWAHMPVFFHADWLEPAAQIVSRGAVEAHRLVLGGWAVDPSRLVPAREVVVLAKGRLLARVPPALELPDLVKAFHSRALERAGFFVFREWIGADRSELDDVGVYAVSLDGRASPLDSTWSSRTRLPSEIRLGGAPPIRVVSDAARGSVDVADLRREVIATFELPEEMRLLDVSGFELDAEVSKNATIEIADWPFPPRDPAVASNEPPPPPISFQMVAPASRTYDLIVDNCPQWYGLRGRTLYLRYSEGVVVRKVRVLVRADARAPAPTKAQPGPAAANALAPR